MGSCRNTFHCFWCLFSVIDVFLCNPAEVICFQNLDRPVSSSFSTPPPPPPVFFQCKCAAVCKHLFFLLSATQLWRAPLRFPRLTAPLTPNHFWPPNLDSLPSPSLCRKTPPSAPSMPQRRSLQTRRKPHSRRSNQELQVSPNLQ